MTMKFGVSTKKLCSTYQNSKLPTENACYACYGSLHCQYQSSRHVITTSSASFVMVGSDNSAAILSL